MTQSRDHAVVVGGSLAGLLTARVLSDHFDKVTIVERDRFPTAAGDRPGVAQARHLHVLWTKGLEIGEELFPGLEAELLAAGVPEVGVPSDLLWLTAAGWRRRFDVTRLLTFSRGLLDWTVLNRLRGTVDLLEGHEVTGLLPASTTGRPGGDGSGTGGARDVAGVLIRPRGASPAAEPMPADLVVDASGRGSRAADWLTDLGHAAPKVTQVDPLLGYASRNYAVPAGFDPGWKALYLQADPSSRHVGRYRTGGLFPQEGGRWIVSLSGAGGDYGPTGERAFLDFAKNLRHPVLYEAIRDAEPLTPISGFRRTANHRRHYERMRAWPAGFLVIGDAVCAFNPIYGQGMSVAALQASMLDSLLRGDGDPRLLGRRFQRLAARKGAGAWLIATGEDRRYRETVGPRVLPHTKIINAYVSRVVAAADNDPVVCASLLDVLALRSGPFSLLRPSVARRVPAAARRPHATDPALLRVTTG